MILMKSCYSADWCFTNILNSHSAELHSQEKAGLTWGNRHQHQAMGTSLWTRADKQLCDIWWAEIWMAVTECRGKTKTTNWLTENNLFNSSIFSLKWAHPCKTEKTHYMSVTEVFKVQSTYLCWVRADINSVIFWMTAFFLLFFCAMHRMFIHDDS